MEITIEKRDFLRGLTRTHNVADKKSSVPILSNVLISTEGPGTVRMAATDLYLGVNISVSAEVQKEGSTAVSARTLFDIVKNLPEGKISFKVDEKHSAQIEAGKVRYRLPGMVADDFPTLPSVENSSFTEVDASYLSELITMTQYSMSTDETRPHLAGALFEGDGKTMRMVTTDGHRLSKAEQKLKNGAMLNFTMLVPNRGIAELKRIIEDTKGDKVKPEKAAHPSEGAAKSTTKSSSEETPQKIGIAISGGSAFFRKDGVQLSVKLADDQFPPYAKVIPQAQDRRVAVQRLPLVDSLKRISLVANEKNGGIRLHIEDGILRITSENPEVGEGTEELEVDFAGEPVDVGFNARYLLDVLGSLVEDEIALELSGGLDPGVIKPVGDTDFVGVVMPMRI